LRGINWAQRLLTMSGEYAPPARWAFCEQGILVLWCFLILLFIQLKRWTNVQMGRWRLISMLASYVIEHFSMDEVER
jgi:hypothetical protein